VNEAPNTSQMMIIVLGHEEEVIHQPHRLLQSGMHEDTRIQSSIDFRRACHETDPRSPEIRQDILERTRVVVGFKRLAIAQVSRAEF